MKTIFTWVIKLTAVVILVQTLFFKFTAAPESVFIFSSLGIEPYGRIGSGVGELIASILILIPRTTLLGALMGLGTMLGAIASHLLVLGVVIQYDGFSDGGLLFSMAVITFACCAILVYQNKAGIPDLLRFKI